MKIRSVGA